MLRALSVAFITILLSACSSSTPAPTATTLQATASELAMVTTVVDGDTIKVRIGGKANTIRIIGIDTPETVDPNDPVQCYGPEASAKANETLYNKDITLVKDPPQGDRDKYDRLLRYIEIGTTDYGLWMISNGYAREYTYDKPYARQAAYKVAQADAKNKALGFWSPSTCSGDTKQPAGKRAPSAATEPALAIPTIAVTAAPTISTTASAQTITAGAFCPDAGATGVTSAGKPMVCKTAPDDNRLRWRSR